MIERRNFLKTAVAGAAGCVLGSSFFEMQLFADAPGAISEDGFRFTSQSLIAKLSRDAPEFVELSVDGLGKGKRGANVMQPPNAMGYFATVVASNSMHRIEYRLAAQEPTGRPVWVVELSDRKILLTSQWTEGIVGQPFIFRFDLAKCHSTVLGLFKEDKTLSIPSLIHMPGQGSIRLTASRTDGAGLGYHAVRHSTLATLAFPAATEASQRISYTLEVTAIYPELAGIANDARFDPFKRNWLDVLQLNPDTRMLSNNTASTSCAFCYYEYADIAALSPPLAEGLTALDLVRQTLDVVMAGARPYGFPALGNFPSYSSDTLPSMLIAAANCVRAGKSDEWLKSNYARVKSWADIMIATDKSGDGLFKYSVSGNSGIWPDGFPMVRPSNWWDTIGFGYEDAYGNALAFRSLHEMAMMAERLGKVEDAAYYRAVAAKLQAAYFKTFFNPETGVIGGWRSQNGELHDYYFLWVNGIAIHYGLVPKDKANAIMDKLLAKMNEVGYDKFNMGLPGNLITVGLKDYVHRTPDGRFGGGVLADNSDGFQNYENGGATGCFAFFTLAALYGLGRKADADRILFAMLDEFDKGGFEGRGKNGKSNDWRRWDGTPEGYEGFLSDNYYTLLAVPLRQSRAATAHSAIGVHCSC